MVIIEVNNNSASAKIALQGAHIFHYARKGEKPLLWLSDISDFQDGKAIRGGVPVCWPSFGMNNPNLPQHGFARTALFEHQSTKEIDANTTEVILTLSYSQETLTLWPYKFELELKVTVSDKLTMELITKNIDDKVFKITQALHTYFPVSHISDAKIKGLNNKPYLDALTSEQLTQSGDVIFEEEVDRVYQEVNSEVLLVDRDRTIHIQNEGSSSVVVWNPWIEKGKRMSAMRDDAYNDFVCIESANAFEDFRLIEPGESHTLKATIY
ncbi:aldose 1-epimerase [Sulfurimonas gotlandica GD1]|uniref:Putative glucose-6-phosphate 1-epimerase n=1 Tax=Sulfurimonas gotlandica (strain DSM 19862 / JCM 16533 / GD1) TaxID=929558 RepID=B6BGC7_SULGG|nr:D-hexose-6-phosphate mutarotase [Sulfurimonas gotlandica]EDZ63367.1 aldose 1-epimerase [Sulfurimonas gotlandica GD1]EHP29554.1 aldose 1-epimerase [Sulfurimonas gotlandica GD1]